MDWEKIFANYATNKDVTSKLYKQLLNLKKKKKNTQSKDGQESRTDISPKKKCHTDGQ